MLLLEKYIVKAMVQAITVVIVLIMGVVVLLSTLTELKNVGNGDYHLLQVMGYVVMRLPSELYHFSPMILLLGTIGGLLVLTRSNELVVMRSAGFSSYRIAWAIMLAASLMIAIMTFLGETAAPRFSLMAVMQKENARQAGHALVTKSGVWFHVDNDFIHADQVISGEFLEGVTRYEFNAQRQLRAVYSADKLILQDKTWQLRHVKKTLFSPLQTNSESFDSLPWAVKLDTELFNDIIEPSEMSLKKLAQFSHYLKQNGLQASTYEYAFWQRILQPLVNLMMVLIAIPFAFSASSRHQSGMPMMMGVLLGITFFIADAFLEQVCIVYQLPAWCAALLPLLILSAIGYVCMRKMWHV